MKSETSFSPAGGSVGSGSSAEAKKAQIGCGLMARYPISSLVICAGTGLALGYGLSEWEPEDPEDKKDAVRWVGLLGDLFIRALKCVVLPLVFVNVALATADMLGLGKARKVAGTTVGFYLLTTVLAATIGIISVSMFQGSFVVNIPVSSSQSRFQFMCADGTYMTQMPDGSVECLGMNSTLAMDQQFKIKDMDKTFTTSSAGGPANSISLSNTIYDGVFVKLVANNVFGVFVSSNFASVIVMALVFGVAVYKVNSEGGVNRPGVIMALFRELEKALMKIINGILIFTPFAVLSLIATAVGKQSNIGDALTNVGLLVATALTAFLAHFFIVYCGLFMLVTKSNPLEYLKNLVPAQVFAFACASSAATIPVTMQCVIDSKKVSPLVARFVVPLGATLNMDGGAIYMSIAIIFLAVTSGIADQINAASYILLVIIATIGSAGTAPVPSASLVLIITAYNTVFNASGTPPAFSFILAIDWLLDRFRTTLNITGDAVVARMVSSLTSDEDLLDLQAGDEAEDSTTSNV